VGQAIEEGVDVHATDRSSAVGQSPAVEWVELAVALVLILASAELFTNGVEWVGENLGLSEGVVGSVLAAVGTALPETLLPLVAILLGHGVKGQDIGIGAILGAPFMLSTLAMFVVGVSVLVFARGGRRGTDLKGNRRVLLQDLGYFLVMYTLAVVAGLFHHTWFKLALAVALLIGYVLYVLRHLRSPEEKEEEAEAVGEVRPLYLLRILRRAGAASPPLWGSVTQVGVALAAMLSGARVFVLGVDRIANDFSIPPLALALLIAPIATELPEKFNSVIWLRRGKDTLALGNVTGAMVFQSAFPVTIGLLLTPWRLTGDALVAGVVALVAGAILWLTLRIRGRFSAPLLLAQGALFAGYVAYVISKL
jgi:cation:H+ antiporter